MQSFVSFVRDQFFGGVASRMMAEFKALSAKDKQDIYKWAVAEGHDVEAPKITPEAA